MHATLNTFIFSALKAFRVLILALDKHLRTIGLDYERNITKRALACNASFNKSFILL